MFSNKFIKAVLITGLIAGALDATAATIQYLINTGSNENPAKVFRYIAGAAFGKEYAKTKNLYAMAEWGFLFHMTISVIWTFLFFLFFRHIRAVLKNKYVAGISYGLFVWTVMNLVVVPVAFGAGINFQLKNALVATGILIVAIGLPVSLLADRFYSKK